MRPFLKGLAEWFTGDVSIETIAQGSDRPGVDVIAVHFAPGARTAWHSHRGGQLLYVVAGEGLVQSRGEAVVTIRAGDAVLVPDGEWHWHGATTDNAMTHLSITDGDKEWGHHVTDTDHRDLVPG